MNKQTVLEVSKKFWDAMEHADENGMRGYAHPDCKFVHIGITCDLDKEIQFYTSGQFQPTNITFHTKDVSVFDTCAIVITDCEYALLLNGKETSHHFAVTEVYDKAYRLIQFTFTALVY